MHKIITLLSMAVIYSISYAQISTSVLPLIPLPKEVSRSKEEFVLTAKTKIVLPNNTFKPEVDYLNNYLQSNVHFQLAIVSSIPKKGNYISINPSSSKTGLKEGYDLKMNKNKIILVSEDNAGIFYGIETLIQLMPLNNNSISGDDKLSIQCANITDSPQYQWRSMLLDCSRHFFSKEEIKKYLDYLAMYKFNIFHWHLTDDQGWRIEIKKYPLLTSIGSKRKETAIGRPRDKKFDGIPSSGFYTQDDIKEIVAYATTRHITILPEIEMPGHSVAALAAYSQYSCTGGPFETKTSWGISKDVYCAGNDSTFLFLQNILSEVMDLFPGKYIHIGGDECPKDRWKACSKCQKRITDEKLSGENELQSYFVNRMEKYVHSKGKQIIGWDEILEQGLSPNATVMSWRGTKAGILAAKQKHFVVMTPTKPCYFDFYQDKDTLKEPYSFHGYNLLDAVYAFNPTPKELTKEDATYIMGAQGCVWTEFIPDFSNVEYMALPRMAALSETVWTPIAKKNYSDFILRLKLHAQTLDRMKVNYAKHFLNQ